MATNKTKSGAVTPANKSLNAATGFNLVKGGQGYAYDSWRTYDGDDNQFYDAIGVATTPVNKAKS